MISPFDNISNTICLFLEPILNTYYHTYQEVITLSDMPTGPLSNMVSLIRTDKLSSFQNTPVGSPSMFSYGCNFVLCRYPCKNGHISSMKNSNMFMFADDIPKVFSFLIANGYTIDTSITEMLNSSKNHIVGGVSSIKISGNKKMICMFSRPI